MVLAFILGFLTSAILFFWYSIFSITSNESRREERKEEKKTHNPPVNYCGEMPVADDPRWNIFDGD